MEKFERANLNRCTASPAANAEIINAHSEAIEALAERIDISANIDRGREERAGEWREALEARLGDVEHLLRAHTDNHATARAGAAKTHAACDPSWMTEVNNALRRIDQRFIALDLVRRVPRKPLPPLHWSRTMTADEAVAIILAEQDKLLDTLADEEIKVWTRGVVALMVGALREHGREDR